MPVKQTAANLPAPELTDEEKAAAAAAKEAEEAAAAEAAAAAAKPPEGDPKPDDEPPPKEGEDDGPPTGREDPLLASIFKDLEDEEVEIKPVKEEDDPLSAEAQAAADKEKKDKEEADAAAAKAAEEAAAAAAKKPPVKKKVQVIKGKEVEDVTAPAPPVRIEPPQPPAPKLDADAEYIKTLSEEQIEELRDAQFAEANMPERYKGQSAKLLKFYKDFDAWTVKAREENPSRTFDTSDEGYVAWMKANKPFLQPADYRKVQTGRITQEAAAEAERRVQPKLEAAELKTRTLELAPKIEAVAKEVEQGLVDLLAVKDGDGKEDYAADAAAKLVADPAAAAQEFPMEVKMIENAQLRWGSMARFYMAYAGGIAKFDDANPVHNEVLQFVNREGEMFASQAPKKYQIKDGKQFLPRVKMAQMRRTDPAADQKYWTFDHRQILEIMAIRGKREVNEAIKLQRAQMHSFGWEPKQKNGAPTAKKDETVKPIKGPKSKGGTSPGPAAADKGVQDKDDGSISVRVLYPK